MDIVDNRRKKLYTLARLSVRMKVLKQIFVENRNCTRNLSLTEERVDLRPRISCRWQTARRICANAITWLT